jgi:glycine C-acetyltransferase
MDGDLTPLPEPSACCPTACCCFLDDAHGRAEGATGARPSIGVEARPTSRSAPSAVFVATGGFVAAPSRSSITSRFFARSHMFSASLSPAVIAMCSGLDVIEREPERLGPARQCGRHTAGLPDRDQRRFPSGIIAG